MDHISQKFGEILNLSSLLGKKEAEEFTCRAQKETLRVDRRTASAEILRNLNSIITDLRNVLPNYEVLTADAFRSREGIDVLTLGHNVISFDEYQALGIPHGTRIVKEEGHTCGNWLTITLGDGMTLRLKKSNFPEYGIRIQPRQTKK